MCVFFRENVEASRLWRCGEREEKKSSKNYIMSTSQKRERSGGENEDRHLYFRVHLLPGTESSLMLNKAFNSNACWIQTLCETGSNIKAVRLSMAFSCLLVSWMRVRKYIVQSLHLGSHRKAVLKLRAKAVDRKHRIKSGLTFCACTFFLAYSLPNQYIQTKHLFYNCKFDKV